MIRAADLDPLMVKELQGLSRGWATHAGRLAYVGFVGIILYLFQRAAAGPSVWLSPSEYADLGRRLFDFFFWPNLLLVTLASILAAADMVTREVRSRTLGLLLLSPCTPLRIVFGKWKAAMAQVLTLVFCGAPVAAICLYLGGIGFAEVARSLSIMISMAALGAAFAVRYSAKHSTPTRALLVSVLMLAVYSIPCAPFFFIIHLITGTWNLREGRRFLVVVLFSLAGGATCVLHYLTPPLHAALNVYNAHPGWEHSWIAAALFSFGTAWLVLRAAARQIDGRAAALADLDAPSIDPVLQDPFPRLRLPGRRRQSRRDQVWEDRPLLWKELATRAATRVNPSLKLVVFIFLLLFILLMVVATQGQLIEPAFFFWGLFLLLSLLLGSSLFVHEKEARKFEMLLCAPITPWQIVRAKLLAGLVSPESRRVLVLWALTVLGWTWWTGLSGILMCAATSGLFLAFAYVLGALASLRARTMPGAFMFGAGLLCALLVFPLFIPYSHGPSQAHPAELLAFFNPLWVLRPFMETDSRREALAEVLPGFLIYGVYYATLIPFMILYMVRSFGRVAGGSRA